MPYNPYNDYFDTGRFGGTLPRRTYHPSHGGNPYVGQCRPSNYNPSRYQPSYDNSTYEFYATQRATSFPEPLNRRRDHHDNYGSQSRRNWDLDRDRNVRFRPTSDSSIPSYQLNSTSLRGADGSSAASRNHRTGYGIDYNYEPQTRRYDYEDATHSRNRHVVYTTPGRRDRVADWFSRGMGGWGGRREVRQEHRDEDEIYRRARQGAEEPRRDGFRRPAWFSRW